jgi:hypothetical protein
MKLSASIFLFAVSLIQYPAIGATTLTPPVTSQPCDTVQLPDGGIACIPKVAQRYNAAPRLIQLGYTINAQNAEAAKRLCHHWGGTHLMPRPNSVNAWDCFRIGKQ